MTTPPSSRRALPEPRDLATVAEAIPHIAWIAAPDGSTTYVNRQGTEYSGLPADASYDWGWVNLVHPDDAEIAREAWARATRTSTPFALEYRIRRADGAYRWHACRSMPIRYADDGIVAWIGTASDIDDHKQLEASLRESQRRAADRLLAATEELYGVARDGTELQRVQRERALLAAALAAAVEQTAEAVIVTDPDANIVFVNPAFERVSGYRRDEVLGRNPRILQASGQDRSVFQEMWATLRAGRAWHGELLNRRKDGTEYPDSVTITPVFDRTGSVTAYISVQRDVSHVREVEADLVLEARVRGLLGEAIQATARTSTLEEVAEAVCNGLASLPGIHVVSLVAFLDADDAVIVRSRLPAGVSLPARERVPEARARYLQRRAAAGPWGMRSGPGETEHMTDAMREAGVRALAFGPITHGGRVEGVLIVGTCDPRYVAVVAGKMPPLVAFGASANTLLGHRLSKQRREHRLRRAFDHVLGTSAFRTVFQPIIELESGEVFGYEALTRFSSGQRPDACFADAWSVGMGPELEFATLEAAVSAARDLPAGRWLDLNISPRLLEAPDRLTTALRQSSRPIVIEVTEHERIEDYATVRAAVRALGNDIRLAVDDAGVGIANFGHIIELRPDFVKLDTTLVRQVNVDLGRQALVIAMHHFARTAGCRVIAEGVETDDEAGALARLGVEFAQGYWFGRPEPVDRWAAERPPRLTDSPAG